MKEYGKSNLKIVLLGFVLSIVSLTTGIIAIVGYRQEWWRHVEAFSIFGWATYIAIASIVLLIIGIYINRNNKSKSTLVLNILSILFSLPIILGTSLFNYAAIAYPAINDISTDTINPPSYWDMPTPMEYPVDKFAKKQQKAYPDVKTLKLTQTLEVVFQKSLNIINENGWEIVGEDVGEGQIEAVASSTFFGFKDEIVIRLVKFEEGTIVDIRSRSRIGKIDRGANAKRIINFIKKLMK